MKVVKSLYSKSCLEHILFILCPVTLEQYSQGVREWKTCIVLETNFLDEGSRLETLCLDSMSVYIYFLSRSTCSCRVQVLPIRCKRVQGLHVMTLKENYPYKTNFQNNLTSLWLFLIEKPFQMVTI